MALNLRAMQFRHTQWREKNFPGAEPWEALVGALEELGELAHAHLKGKWGIRGMTRAAMMKKKADAIGDIVIYLISYCGTNGLDFETCITDAWAEVQARDWQANPKTGGKRG